MILACILASALLAQAQVTTSSLVNGLVDDISIVGAAAAFDVWTTGYNADRGLAETNPLGQSIDKRVALKLASAILTVRVTHQLRRSGHPRLAKAVRFGVAGIFVGAGVVNLTRTRKEQ